MCKGYIYLLLQLCTNLTINVRDLVYANITI